MRRHPAEADWVLASCIGHHGFQALAFHQVPEADVAVVRAGGDQGRVGADVYRGDRLGVSEDTEYLFVGPYIPEGYRAVSPSAQDNVCNVVEFDMSDEPLVPYKSARKLTLLQVVHMNQRIV